jgi:hypothetical protein
VRAAPGCCIVSRYGQSASKSHTRLLRNDDLDAVAGGRPHDLPSAPMKTFIILASFCQIYSLRSYPAGRDVVRCMRPRMGSAAVHKLRSAVSCPRDQQRLPLKTFIILASFCQIYSLRSYPAGRDVLRCMRPRMGSAGP